MSRIDFVLAALLSTLLGGPTIPSSAAADEPEPQAPPFIGPPRQRERIVIVTIDGVRWQEIFGGLDDDRIRGLAPRTAAELTPNLHALLEHDGAALGGPGHGAITASGPNFVSLPGYREILTGKQSTSCQDNDCTDPAPQTILDEASDAGLDVAAFASWERLDRAVRGHGYPTSFGRHGDPKIDPSPGSGDFRPDALTAAAAVDYFASHRPDVMYVGLGEPDEYAHDGDYAGYIRSIQAADAVVGRLWNLLKTVDDRGGHLFVTADHGRDRGFRHHGGYDPQSARVWLFAAGPRIQARGYVTAGADRRLRDIAPTVRTLLDLPPRRGGTVLGELFE